MAYTKPQIVAQNSANGTFAAGCPAEYRVSDSVHATGCRSCEMTM
jgi:hypothetical protein